MIVGINLLREGLDLPEVPTWLSLAVIVVAIGGASVASVIKMKSMESAEKA